MGHFAKIENNKVTQVIVVNNKDLQDKKFPESEPIGQKFIESIGLEGYWLQTSYNKTFRKNFAGIGSIYDKNDDAFIPEKPFDSWVLNRETFNWEAPTSQPSDGGRYFWDEESLTWKEIN